MAEAVVNGKIQPKRTKAMNIRFHWLRDIECQYQFRIYWRPGKSNYADYWTKHHPEKHHRNTRKEFFTPPIVLEMLRIEQKNSTTKSTQATRHKRKHLPGCDDMSSKQVLTEVPVDGQTVRKTPL